MTRAAFCPISPLLFRHLSGKADGAAGLRSEAVGTVRDALAGATAVTVLVPVGGREAPEQWWDPSGRVPGGRPLGTQVGEHLLALAGCTVPTTYVECRDVTGPQLQPFDSTTAVLVLGDGAACRREGAPGYIDDRSFAYDDTVAAALGSGDTAVLAGLDRSLGAELLATGRLTWPVAAAAITPASAELRYRDDPYGLSWFVALWR
jgi:hypothetical protein